MSILTDQFGDDTFARVVVPFPYYFQGMDFGNNANGGIAISSNMYFTFGGTSTVYNGLSATSPSFRTVFVGAKDASWNRVLVHNQVRAARRGILRSLVAWFRRTGATGAAVASASVCHSPNRQRLPGTQLADCRMPAAAALAPQVSSYKRYRVRVEGYSTGQRGSYVNVIWEAK
jgi:hypothetical protein